MTDSKTTAYPLKRSANGVTTDVLLPCFQHGEKLAMNALKATVGHHHEKISETRIILKKCNNGIGIGKQECLFAGGLQSSHQRLG